MGVVKNIFTLSAGAMLSLSFANGVEAREIVQLPPQFCDYQSGFQVNAATCIKQPEDGSVQAFVITDDGYSVLLSYVASPDGSALSITGTLIRFRGGSPYANQGIDPVMMIAYEYPSLDQAGSFLPDADAYTYYQGTASTYQDFIPEIIYVKQMLDQTINDLYG